MESFSDLSLENKIMNLVLDQFHSGVDVLIKQIESRVGYELEIKLWKPLAIRLRDITQRSVEKRAKELGKKARPERRKSGQRHV